MATAFASVINAGEYQYIYDGDTASGVTINGGYQYIYSGGAASGVTINYYGEQDIFSDGLQFISGGAVSDVTINYGGDQYIYSGGAASGVAINSGGSQIISGGTASGVTINGGDQYIYSGGTASGVTINYGGDQCISGGAASGVTINHGWQSIYSGGSASSVTINDWGSQYIYSGGSASSVTINECYQYIFGGSASSVTINSGGLQFISGGAVSDVTINNGGDQSIYSGGTSYNTVVSSGGVQVVNAGGSAINATIRAGGSQTVASGGIVRGATVAKKGMLRLNNGAKASSIILSSGAAMKTSGNVSLYGKNVFTAAAISGQANKNIALAKNASLNLGANTRFSNLNLAGGSGRITVSGAGVQAKIITLVKATSLTFDLSKIAARGTTPLLKSQTRKAANGKFAITTIARQGMGRYELAANLSIAKGTVFKVKAGSVSVGNVKLNGAKVKKYGVQYALATSGQQVNLTLTAIAGKALKGTARADNLKGTANCDIFYGGKGNDRITGGGGRDIAVYDKTAWGRDTIAKQAAGGTMTIVFNGLKASSISKKKSGKNMIISRKGTTGQSITVQNWNDATHNIVFGGTLGQFSKYAAAAKPTASQVKAARNEVWKKTGMLA